MTPTKIALAAVIAGCLGAPAAAGQEAPEPAPAGAAPTVTIALLPAGTEPEDLAPITVISPGLLSAGLGEVPAAQTYLDVTQGNRIFSSLYGSALDLPPPRGGRVPGWGEVVERARSAPAEIVPGLLASALAEAGVRSPRGAAIEAAAGLTYPALLAADRGGAIGRLPPSCPSRLCAAPVVVRAATLAGLQSLAAGLRGSDLLIALERPPPPEREALTIGIAGRGYNGNLTSDSTRTDGYVLSTDIAPTVLERFGVPVPDEISGEPIRAEGERDPEAVASLGARLSEIGGRRGAVIVVSVLAWLATVGLAALLSGGRAAPQALRLLALSVVYLPLMLLAGAALEPSTGAERLLVGLGAPALGAITLALLGGYRALAAACAVTVLAQAIDVLGGSPLTSLSLVGPNPGLGVRFFGIGNELEAILAPLVIVGTGAALAGFAPRLGTGKAAAAFLGAGLAAAFVFAAGRFGADVGAAIVLPVGAAVAAALVTGRRSAALLVIAAPLGALALLALIDLASGGDAHLTRSVLDAGGFGDLADVAERRLRLSARSFSRAITSPFLPLVLIVLAAAFWKRETILGWLEPHPTVRAGFLGAAAATVVGTLANDSGALLLEVGTAYLLLFAGYAWAEARVGPHRPYGP
jgi:hypothetical protein